MLAFPLGACIRSATLASQHIGEVRETLRIAKTHLELVERHPVGDDFGTAQKIVNHINGNNPRLIHHLDRSEFARADRGRHEVLVGLHRNPIGKFRKNILPHRPPAQQAGETGIQHVRDVQQQALLVGFLQSQGVVRLACAHALDLEHASTKSRDLIFFLVARVLEVFQSGTVVFDNAGFLPLFHFPDHTRPDRVAAAFLPWRDWTVVDWQRREEAPMLQLRVRLIVRQVHRDDVQDRRFVDVWCVVVWTHKHEWDVAERLPAIRRREHGERCAFRRGVALAADVIVLPVNFLPRFVRIVFKTENSIGGDPAASSAGYGAIHGERFHLILDGVLRHFPPGRCETDRVENRAGESKFTQDHLSDRPTSFDFLHRPIGDVFGDVAREIWRANAFLVHIDQNAVAAHADQFASGLFHELHKRLIVFGDVRGIQGLRQPIDSRVAAEQRAQQACERSLRHVVEHSAIQVGFVFLGFHPLQFRKVALVFALDLDFTNDAVADRLPVVDPVSILRVHKTGMDRCGRGVIIHRNDTALPWRVRRGTLCAWTVAT